MDIYTNHKFQLLPYASQNMYLYFNLYPTLPLILIFLAVFKLAFVCFYLFFFIAIAFDTEGSIISNSFMFIFQLQLHVLAELHLRSFPALNSWNNSLRKGTCWKLVNGTLTNNASFSTRTMAELMLCALVFSIQCFQPRGVWITDYIDPPTSDKPWTNCLSSISLSSVSSVITREKHERCLAVFFLSILIDMKAGIDEWMAIWGEMFVTSKLRLLSGIYLVLSRDFK